MFIKEYIHWYFVSMRENKLRTWLSMLWIIIWVFSVIVLLAIWEWTQQDIVDKFNSMWANLITISAGWWSRQYDVRATSTQSTDILDDSLVEYLGTLDGIEKISPYVSTRQQVVYGTYNTNASIVWVTPIYKELKNLELSMWKFITEEDDNEMTMNAVIWYELSNSMFWTWVDPTWKDIDLENSILTVVWVLEDNSNYNTNIFIPLTTAQLKIIWTHYYNTIDVWVEEWYDITEFKDYINSELLDYFDITDSSDAPFSVRTLSEILESVSEVTDMMKALLAWIAAISLLVGWIWVMNIMLVSVTERTREIWIRKAIWARRKDILQQFLTEAVILSFIAGMIWIWLSFVATAIINNFTTAIITLQSVLIWSVSAITIWIVFGILPASKAAKLKPIDALRYE